MSEVPCPTCAQRLPACRTCGQPFSTVCRTCAECLTPCACAPPEPPDVLSRGAERESLREALLRDAGDRPGPANPLVRALVLAVQARILAANAATLQRMGQELQIPPSTPERRKGTGIYPTQAPFLKDILPLLAQLRDARRHPSAEAVAALLPTQPSERTLRRVVKRLFGVRWEDFRRHFFRYVS
jgi:hypothetical protein